MKPNSVSGADILIKKEHFYDDYDYATFWRGREYEDMADQMAVRRLLKKTKGQYKRIVDLGGGSGRMAAIYLPIFDESILVDPSQSQLNAGRKKLGQEPHAVFMKGSADHIPLPPESVDMILCIRVFHYIADPVKAFAEMKRVVRPGGYLLIEIPNKINFKARLRSIVSWEHKMALKTHDPINLASNKDDTFLNHDPRMIASRLESEGFSVLGTLSVSNFRNPAIKKRFSLKLLLALEWITQPLFAHVWFGPSVYFLARAEK